MLIVDANNVTHAAGDGGEPDGVVRLVGAIVNSRYASGGAVLVCDGSPGRLSAWGRGALVSLMAGRGGNDCRVVYAGPEREADDVIEQMIAAAARPERVTVVSSDARLARAAFRAGAKALRAQEFLEHLDKDRAKRAARGAPGDDGLDRAAVAWWMRYFGFTPGPGESAASPPPQHGAAPRPKETPPRSKQFPTAPSGEARAPSDWLNDAMRMWPGIFRPEELDMEQWLGKAGAERRKRAGKAKKKKDTGG
jgi:hypothetical protein